MPFTLPTPTELHKSQQEHLHDLWAALTPGTSGPHTLAISKILPRVCLSDTNPAYIQVTPGRTIAHQLRALEDDTNVHSAQICNARPAPNKTSPNPTDAWAHLLWSEWETHERAAGLNPEYRILDLCAGTGSLRKVARQLNFPYYSVDSDKNSRASFRIPLHDFAARINSAAGPLAGIPPKWFFLIWFSPP